MRRLRAYLSGLAPLVVAVLALAVQPGTAAADQNDPRLDRLFAVLHTSKDAREIALAENLIWEIWNTHDDFEVARLMRRALFAMANERNGDALRIFDEVIRSHPDFAEAWNKRATLYFTMGELDRSRADVERTLELEPRHFGALSGLGQIELLSGNRDKALAAFEHALDANPHLEGARAMARRLRAQKAGQDL